MLDHRVPVGPFRLWDAVPVPARQSFRYVLDTFAGLGLLRWPWSGCFSWLQDCGRGRDVGGAAGERAAVSGGVGGAGGRLVTEVARRFGSSPPTYASERQLDEWLVNPSPDHGSRSRWRLNMP